jgi:predicted nucleic acid-binding protein
MASNGERSQRVVFDANVVAAALGAKAQAIVSFDRDLLALGKPYGIPILSPSAASP